MDVGEEEREGGRGGLQTYVQPVLSKDALAPGGKGRPRAGDLVPPPEVRLQGEGAVRRGVVAPAVPRGGDDVGCLGLGAVGYDRGRCRCDGAAEIYLGAHCGWLPVPLFLFFFQRTRCSRMETGWQKCVVSREEVCVSCYITCLCNSRTPLFFRGRGIRYI